MQATFADGTALRYTSAIEGAATLDDKRRSFVEFNFEVGDIGLQELSDLATSPEATQKIVLLGDNKGEQRTLTDYTENATVSRQPKAVGEDADGSIIYKDILTMKLYHKTSEEKRMELVESHVAELEDELSSLKKLLKKQGYDI